MSIVLVIIGLLIGGVLIGQSLVDSAKKKRLLSYIKQTEVLVSLYKERFRALPGDDANAQAKFGAAACGSGCDGNGDGRITDIASGSQEGYRMWSHMQLAGILPDSLGVNVPADHPGYGTNSGDLYLNNGYVPNFDDVEEGLSIVGSLDPGTLGYFGGGWESCANAWVVGKAQNGGSSSIFQTFDGALDNSYILFLETKLDGDFLPRNGRVMALRDGTNPGNQCQIHSSNEYRDFSGDHPCSIMYCWEK